MQTYQVQEFAARAGVTVRTLRYYDQMGLLTPVRDDHSNHRHYQDDDLLRLQQILTLKALGFSLAEIKNLLDSPSYDIRRALRAQQAVIDAQIERLQRAAQALEETLALIGTTQGLDWTHVTTLIRIVSAKGKDDKDEWLRRYFSDEQLEQLSARAVPPETIRAGEQAWMDLIAAFRAVRDRAPGDPAVQALAAQMAGLIAQFTGGDPALRASLEAMYADPEQIPAHYRLADADLYRLMDAAFRIYEQTNQDGSAAS
ncbi:MAG: MerR family transcriptional regulator [Chloroflexi bacterium]|nr:MerR family transcriptional regulator [Chloroflexota bacterium]